MDSRPDGRALVLVEDDPGDTLLVAEMLGDVAPNLNLVCFTSLKAALAGWPANAECVLLDLGLPDAIGLTALQELRSKVPDVPIVVLTGRIDDGIGPIALAAGVLIAPFLAGSSLAQAPAAAPAPDAKPEDKGWEPLLCFFIVVVCLLVLLHRTSPFRSPCFAGPDQSANVLRLEMTLAGARTSH